MRRLRLLCPRLPERGYASSCAPSSICMVAICSAVTPFFAPYWIQYFVEAFTNIPRGMGIVTRRLQCFLVSIALASFLIFHRTEPRNGVPRIASPLPISSADPNGNPA